MLFARGLALSDSDVRFNGAFLFSRLRSWCCAFCQAAPPHNFILHSRAGDILWCVPSRYALLREQQGNPHPQCFCHQRPERRTCATFSRDNNTC